MAENVPCIIHDGTVCSPSMVDEVLPTDTPATAIPNGVLAEVRLALVDARTLAIAHAIGYAIQHGIDPKGEKWHPTHKDIVDRATAALTLLGDTP